MSIVRVEAYALRYAEPNDNGNQRCAVLCRIDDSDGACGWGEAVTMTLGASRAVVALIDSMSELLIGESCVTNGVLWRKLREHGWWHAYEGGIASFALSALDIALWDLKGRLLGLSLVDLLGGALRTHLPAIATTHPRLSSLEAEAERHGGYVSGVGLKGVKVGFGKSGEARLGYDIERDVHFVELLRQAIGPEAILIVDRGHSLPWTVDDAIRRTKIFSEQGILWIEEPFEPEDEEGFRRLRGQVSCMIGTGEREWTTRGYRRVIDSGVVDVVGFDPGRAEGVTGGVKVIDLVESSKTWFNAHAFSGALITAASLALSATTDRCLLFEMKPIPSPMQDELIYEPFRVVNGEVEVPSAPGLGVNVDPTVVEKYRVA